MRYLKLYENFNESDIHKICKKYNIENYTINDDGTIDVEGEVNLYRQNLKKLPLKFRNVTGTFNCYNNQLTSLKGCPISVGGEFICDDNKLTSLEGCPEYVGDDFNCTNNQLTSLKFMPKLIDISFYCDHNYIRDFKGFLEPTNNFYCDNNPIYEIWELFKDKSHIELLNDYDCIRGEDIVIDRLNEFLEEIDKPTVESVDGYNNI